MLEVEFVIQQYDISKEQLFERRQYWPFQKFRRVSGIYFLIRDSEIVYVGKSANVLDRLSKHIEKGFDSFSIVECSWKDMRMLEPHFIYKFSPPLNVTPPTNRIYQSFNQITAKYCVTAPTLRRWMRFKGIEVHRSNLYRSSDFNDIDTFLEWMRRQYPTVDVRYCAVDYLEEFVEKSNSSGNPG
jgi:hypothetical protein